MGERLRAALVVSAAVAVMALTAVSASAVEMSVAPAGAISATATVTFTGGSMTIRCPVTLSGTVSSGLIPVRAEAQYGEIAGVTIGQCEGGKIERALRLPWPILISRSLPSFETLTTSNATGILSALVGAAIKLEIFGGFVNCLYMGTAAGLAPLSATTRGGTRYTTRTINALETANIPLVEGGLGCPSEGHFNGSFTFTGQTVTLS